MEKKTSSRIYKTIKEGFAFDALVIFILTALHYVIFARPVFKKEYFFAGDGYHLWEFKYVILLSLKKFNALPWWDPVAYNGFPLYYHFISAWPNCLSPFYVPSLIIFKIVSHFVSINTYYIFHLAVYVVLLNITAIYLISRELTTNKVAAVLPAFIFTFSYFQVLNFHDPFVLESMIPALFYIYALIRYNNRRTGANLLLFCLFTGLLLASLNNGIVMSAFFWSGIFTVLLLVFTPGIAKDTFNLISELFRTRKGKFMLALSVLLLCSGILAAWSAPHYNLGHVLRYRGGDQVGEIVPVDYTSSNEFSNQPIPVEESRIWTIIFNWIPLPEVHNKILTFTWSGHDYRYIGLATLPLLLAAIVFGLENYYVYILFMSYFLCNGFIIYTESNLAYRILIESSNIFKNVRNMATIFPRGGPLLFLIFLSGIGLDYLLKISDNSNPGAGKRDIPHSRFFNYGLKTLFFLGLIALIAGAIVTFPRISWRTLLFGRTVSHTIFHVGFYLAVFSWLCWALYSSDKKAVKRYTLICLFIFIFTDLTISASQYIDEIDKNQFTDYGLVNWPHTYYGRVPYQTYSRRGMLIPDGTDLKPAASEAENMFPPNYIGGAYHNPWEINSAIKEWLVLATRETGQKFLSNWNSATLRMKKYPDFRFFSNGFYLPFKNIENLDADQTIVNREPLFYLHDKNLIAKGVAPKIVDGKYEVKEFTFNEVVITTKTPAESFLYFLDNYDRFWSAYVDGRETEIHRANFCFKAVKLPAGEHTVAWVYNPYPVKMAYVTFYLITIIFLFCYILWCEQVKESSDE